MALEAEKDELMKLMDESDGLITVDMVLEVAQDETNPLHRHFTWDDSKAANEYRRWQARALIAKCRIVIESRPDTEVRAFVSLPSDRLAEGGGYRFRMDVMDNDDQRTELLRDMKKRIDYWSKQASWLDMPTRLALEQFSTAVESAVGQVQQAA